jgi:hypothetical protein
MSFLTDQNLTFHRFSDGTLLNDGHKTSQNMTSESPVWTTGTALDYSGINPAFTANENASSAVLSDEKADELVSKRYSTYSSTCNNSTTSTQNVTNTGSTLKLIQVQRKDSTDTSSSQVS